MRYPGVTNFNLGILVGQNEDRADLLPFQFGIIIRPEGAAGGIALNSV
jgi:hypothetical protein